MAAIQSIPIIKLEDVRAKLDEYGLFDEDSNIRSGRRYDTNQEDQTALHMAKMQHGPNVKVKYSTDFTWYFVIPDNS